MSFWLIALAVWIAAGSRVGRVLVRPATTVRVAIVAAVASVAAAVTIGIPEVADSVDRMLPNGVRAGERLVPLLIIALWVAFTTATAVVAAAAWPITSRENLRRVAAAIYAIGAVFVAITIFWSARIGWAAIVVGCLVIVVTAVRNFDWTPLGRGVGIFAIGTAIVGVLASVHFRELLTKSVPATRPTPTWAWSTASLLISVGAVWILVEMWVRARLLMRQVKVLHNALITRFPEVAQDDPSNTTTVLRASDQVAHIMDALYLLAGGGGAASKSAETPPAGRSERAHAVAIWVRDPLDTTPLDTRWIAPPDGTSTRRWVSTIAQAYTNGAAS